MNKVGFDGIQVIVTDPRMWHRCPEEPARCHVEGDPEATVQQAFRVWDAPRMLRCACPHMADRRRFLALVCP